MTTNIAELYVVQRQRILIDFGQQLMAITKDKYLEKEVMHLVNVTLGRLETTEIEYEHMINGQEDKW